MKSNSTHYRFASKVGVKYQIDSLPPYGGQPAQIPVQVIDAALTRKLEQLPVLDIDEVSYAHLRMFALGAYQPLTGFMGNSQIRSVLKAGCLEDFLPWEVPIILTSEEEMAQGSQIILRYLQQPLALMDLQEVGPVSNDLKSMHTVNKGFVFAGDLILLMNPQQRLPEQLNDWNALLDRTPSQFHQKRVTALAGVDPWRANDEHLIRTVLEFSDQVILHPTAERKGVEHGVLPEGAAEKANRQVLTQYFSDNQVIDSPVPRCLNIDTRSAIHLAIIYQNIGCQTLVVVSENPPAQIQDLAAMDIGFIAMPSAVYCSTCARHVNPRVCRHSDEVYTKLNENQIVQRLTGGEHIPAMVVRPTTTQLLVQEMSVSTATDRKTGSERNIFPHLSEVSHTMRQRLNGHKAAVLWMTGLSGAGKSTLAMAVEKELLLSGHQVTVLDGDGLRNGMCSDLGFSVEDRSENLRRAAESAKLMMNSGLLVLASFISPFNGDREMIREIIGEGFREVYVEAMLEDCERRDPKGLYKRARSGSIPEFTGVSSPYDVPANPDIRVNTSLMTLQESIRFLLSELKANGFLKQDLNLDSLLNQDAGQSQQDFHVGRSS